MGVSLSTPSASGSSFLNRFQCSTSTDSTTGTLSTTGDSPFSDILSPTNLKIVTFEELESATNNFNSDMLIGEGLFGRVYKGWLHENTLSPAKPGSGMLVAIKKMKPESVQGFHKWQFLSMLSHPNLIKLLGYCWEDNQLLLVSEFMPEGSLENHLFRTNPNSLSWNTRLKIAIDAARGLCFLHACQRPVMHGGLKASNILLDMNYNAKISDFGFPNVGPLERQSRVTTRTMGTLGYVAPEYVATGHLLVKSDVYVFGVVLLEIITGMRAVDNKRPTGKQSLVEWTMPCLSSKKKLKTIMDAKIEGQYSDKAARQAAQLILKCLEFLPKQRPSMKDVLEALEAIEAIQNPK